MSEPSPDDYPIRVRMPVAWGQLDAYGHVNNTQFFRFFEDARLAYFEKVGISARMAATQRGPILAKTSCVFRKPLGYPDAVLSCVRVSEMGDDRFTMEHAIFSDAVGLAALGDARIVMLDYGTGQKVAVDDDIRAAIDALAPRGGAPAS
jgi:acyl-CoA thioester hydrolase